MTQYFQSPVGCVGCDVVGAEQLMGRAGVWSKTHLRQVGHELVATTYLVAAGNPRVFEVRVDLRPLEKLALAMHRKLHAKMRAAAAVAGEEEHDLVGWGLKALWRKAKNTAKKVARNKIVRTVSKIHRTAYKVVKTVAKNKYVSGTVVAALTAFPPTTAIGVTAGAALLAANGAIAAVEKGQALVKGALRTKRDLERTGKELGIIKAKARKKAAKKVAVRRRVSKLSARSKAALAKRLAAKRRAAAAKLRSNKSRVATRLAVAKKRSAQLKARVRKAARIRAKLRQPKVRAALATVKKRSEAAKAALERVQTTARYGTGQQKVDAQKSAAIIALAAQNRRRLTAIAESNAGGLPGILIDGRGRMRRGKFRVTTKPVGVRPQVLYLGPSKNTQQGQFAAVAGNWDIVGGSVVGCADDPTCNC